MGSPLTLATETELDTAWTLNPMLMKSPKLSRASFAVTLFLLIVAFQNASAARVVDEKTSRVFHCRNLDDYKLVVVPNPNRKKDYESRIPEDLNIVVGDEVISRLALLRGDTDAKNLSPNSIEKTKVGFEIKVDWGSGVDHYEIEYDFRCRKNGFYLYKVKKVTFWTSNRDSGTFLDRKKVKITKPNLPLEKVVMTAYL